jgi:uncharacterized protein (DUF58 family)
VLTAKGWAVLFATGGLTGAAVGLGLPEAAGLAAGCAAAILIALAMVWVPPLGARGTATAVPSGVPAGAGTELEVVLELRLPAVGRLLVTGPVSDGRRIRAWVPTPEGRSVSRFPVEVPRRGPVVVGPLRARRVGLLGLTVRTVARTGPVEILGWPPMVDAPAPALAVPGDDGDARWSDPRTVDEGSVGGVRAYQPGDDPRRIAWAASARSEDLLVRIPDPLPSVPAWTVAVDVPAAFPDTSAFELALSVAASLVAGESEARLVLGGEPAGSGTVALDALARAGYEPGPATGTGTGAGAGTGTGLAAGGAAGGTAGSSVPSESPGRTVVVTGAGSPRPTGASRTVGAVPTGREPPGGPILRLCADPSGRGTGTPGEIVVDDLARLDAVLRRLA